MATPNQRRRGQLQLPKYLPAVVEAAALADVQPGRVYLTAVQHDPWCALLAGKGACNCSPKVCLARPLGGKGGAH